MRALSQLPRSVLILEVLGGLLLVLSWFALHEILPSPLGGKTAATVMIFIGIALMLPAAGMMMWRTARTIAPELFALSASRQKKSGDSHDADH